MISEVRDLDPQPHSVDSRLSTSFGIPESSQIYRLWHHELTSIDGLRRVADVVELPAAIHKIPMDD